jgi:hypothetical protein
MLPSGDRSAQLGTLMRACAGALLVIGYDAIAALATAAS